jgi:hypothetical protein
MRHADFVKALKADIDNWLDHAIKTRAGWHDCPVLVLAEKYRLAMRNSRVDLKDVVAEATRGMDRYKDYYSYRGYYSGEGR